MNHSPFVFKKMNKDIGLGIFCAVMMTLPEEDYPDLSYLKYPSTGHGLRALIIAARVRAGLEGEPENIIFEAEWDDCYVIFENESVANETGALISAAFRDRDELELLALTALAANFYE